MRQVNIKILNDYKNIVRYVLGYFCADDLKVTAHITPHMVSNHSIIDETTMSSVENKPDILDEMKYLIIDEIEWKIEKISSEDYSIPNIPCQMYKFILSKN